MLAMSTMMERQPPFKMLLGHGLVRDERGEEMHKSKGNSIPFDEAADKMGADLMRWMFCRHNPAANINFGYRPRRRAAQQVHAQAVEHLRLLLQLRPARTASTCRRRPCRSRSGPTSTAGSCRICKS